jgi:hypothetical protein
MSSYPYWWDSYCLILSFLWCVILIIHCLPFFEFRLLITLWHHYIFFQGRGLYENCIVLVLKEKVNLFFRTKCGTTNNDNINYFKNITNILFYFVVPFLNTSQILRLSVLCVYKVVFQIHICNIILTMKYYHTVTKTMLINF